MGKIKRKIPYIISIILFLLALSFLIFPTFSNAINAAEGKNSIKEYNNNISTLSKAEKEKYLNDAKEYNRKLSETTDDTYAVFTYENIKPEYESVLNFENGQICTVEIPKINVKMPVYHGISESVLSKGAAHSANTSFPIGGESTHSVISAHTAYPGKVFFDDLTEMKNGDVFYINVLDEKLAYKVTDINITEPEDCSKLQIAYGRDLVTLVTCYPYAVNTHRLLVTGERIPISESTQSEPLLQETSENNNPIFIIIIVFVFLVLLAILILIIVIIAKKKKGRKAN